MCDVKKAEDFAVGQVVVCKNPENFLSDRRKYLTGRQGTIMQVFPSTEKNIHLRKNELWVLWHKRNGRGQEQRMFMRPSDVECVSTSSD